jgi:cytoskeletal protein RodZ
MSSTHHPEKTCVTRNKTAQANVNSATLKPAFFQKGLMEIGKLNIVLIGLIVIILITLIAKEDVTSSPLASQEVRVQTVTTPEIAALEPQDTTPEPVAQPEPAKSELKTPAKPRKKPEAASPVVEHSRPAELAAGSPASNAEATPENNPRAETEHTLQKEPSRNILVFNIWSLSELRLRGTFTKLINDGSAPPAIVDARKKEYLTFVNKRTHKCGELHNKFASNINTVEKLNFKEKDVEILECHTAENINELNKLNDSAPYDS